MIRFRAHLTPLLFFTLLGSGCFNSGQGDPSADSAVDASSADVFRFDAGPRPDIGPRLDVGLAFDAGPAFDAGTPSECAADGVDVLECPMFLCNEPARWYRNGHSCFPIECGACEGADCDSAPVERDVCEAAHRTCDPELCRRSMGTWRFWGRSDCGFICGQPSGDDCASGPTCDCGAFSNFVPGRGCVSEDSCIPPPIFIPPEEFCQRSGGEWGGFCEHSHCGQRSAAACVQPACHCPWPQVFDEARGCVESEACFRGDGGCNELSICPRDMACVDGACEFFECAVDG